MSFCILCIIPPSFSGRRPTPFTGFRTSPGDILAWLHPLLIAPTARVGSAALPQGDIPVTQLNTLPTARLGDQGPNPAPCPRAGPGRWDAGADCAQGVFPAKLAEADYIKSELSAGPGLWDQVGWAQPSVEQAGLGLGMGVGHIRVMCSRFGMLGSVGSGKI